MWCGVCELTLESWVFSSCLAKIICFSPWSSFGTAARLCFCLLLMTHFFGIVSVWFWNSTIFTTRRVCLRPSPYNSLHSFIQSKLSSCFFFGFLLKFVVHPKMKIFIYSISCCSKCIRLLCIFETQVAVLDAQEWTSLVCTLSKHVWASAYHICFRYVHLSVFILEKKPKLKLFII